MIEAVDKMSTCTKFYQASQTDAVIGYDGMGPVDYTKSDFFEPYPEADGAGTHFAFHHLRKDLDNPKVFLRRAVKFAELYCLDSYEGFIISEALFHRFEAYFRQSLEAIQPCTAIRFGKHQVSKPYFYGRPRYSDLMKTHVDFGRSMFDIVDPFLFPKSQTKKERGEIPLDSPYPTLVENVKFEDIRRLRPSEGMAVAKHLHLEFEKPPPIFCLSVTVTYFCEEIALYLREQKTLGTAFVGPPAIVCGKALST